MGFGPTCAHVIGVVLKCFDRYVILTAQTLNCLQIRCVFRTARRNTESLNLSEPERGAEIYRADGRDHTSRFELTATMAAEGLVRTWISHPALYHVAVHLAARVLPSLTTCKGQEHVLACMFMLLTHVSF